VITKDGYYEVTDTEQTQRFDPEKVIFIEKFNPEKLSQQYTWIMISYNLISSDLRLKQPL